MPTIVDQETDARFWATGYKPGQKLDPSNPQDAKQIPIWLDIHAKVQREADAGKLVTTFDHPEVVKGIADAHVADKVAAGHLDAAKTAADPAVQQQHIEAASAAAAISKHRTRHAAKHQPPTASPQLTKEASDAAKAEPPHPSAPSSEHLANAQAAAAHEPAPRDVLLKETDARFWAQTGYRPGQKLDPKDPNDAAMIPAWNEVYAKVKAEKPLVLTYNHPVVAQNLADAHVADKVAETHLDTGAAPAAATAAQVSDQRTREAARLQPPSVSPETAHRAAGAADEGAILDRETYARFWATTGYKRGRRLDPRDPADAKWLPVWAHIREQVWHEHLARESRNPPTGRDHLARQQAKGAGHRAEEVHRHHRQHGRPVRSTVSHGNLRDFRAQATRAARDAKAPFVLLTQHPDGTPERRTFGTRAELDAAYAAVADQHDQYRYVAAFDMAKSANAPVHDSVGVPAAEHADVPPEAAAADTAPSPDTAITPADEEKPEGFWTKGKITAVVVGGLVLGGVALAMTGKGKGGDKKSRRSRPKVLVASKVGEIE